MRRATAALMMTLLACSGSADTLEGQASSGRLTSAGYSYDITVVNTGDSSETGTCVVSVADNDGNSDIDHVNFMNVPAGGTESAPIVFSITWTPVAVLVDCNGDGEPDT